MEQRAPSRRPGRCRGRARRAALLAGLAAATLLVLPLVPRAAEELRYFRIGTASPTGTYFQIGGVLANIISKPPGARDCDRGGSCGVPGLVAVAQATQGSLDNAVLVANGQLESALVQNDIAHWAFDGNPPAAPPCARRELASAAPALSARGPLKNLRVIAALFPEHLHVVARAGLRIHRLADLRGLRVGMGEVGSGTLADARLVLAAVGLSECDVKAEYQSLAQAAAAMAAGKLDALFIVGGYPVPALMDLASTTKVQLVPLPERVVKRLQSRFSFFISSEIPRATYPGIDAATPSVSLTALWLVGAQVPDDLVYALTGALWQEATRRLLDGGHPAGRRILLTTALAGMSDVPLHPGAARWYREAGKLPKDKSR